MQVEGYMPKSKTDEARKGNYKNHLVGEMGKDCVY
jgi:hypothetical protein